VETIDHNQTLATLPPSGGRRAVAFRGCVLGLKQDKRFKYSDLQDGEAGGARVGSSTSHSQLIALHICKR